MSNPHNCMSATLDVAEIFFSLQGEGPFMGQPAVFLRLAGCVPPLCPWCDTPHALGPGTRLPVADVVSRVRAHGAAMLVVTGGEPFAQWATGLAELTAVFSGRSRRIQYETSGKAGIPADHRGFVVCSPKPLHAPRLAADCVSRVDAFKFVVDGTNLASVLAFVAENDIAPDKVWLMPLGATRAEQQRRMPMVWEMCARNGFRFAPRLHILTFDTKKGV